MRVAPLLIIEQKSTNLVKINLVTCFQFQRTRQGCSKGSCISSGICLPYIFPVFSQINNKPIMDSISFFNCCKREVIGSGCRSCENASFGIHRSANIKSFELKRNNRFDSWKRLFLLHIEEDPGRRIGIDVAKPLFCKITNKNTCRNISLQLRIQSS